MVFGQALEAMKQGEKVKLPSWSGYWYWDAEKETVMMHTKDGEDIDIRDTKQVEYTLSNIAKDTWEKIEEPFEITDDTKLIDIMNEALRLIINYKMKLKYNSSVEDTIEWVRFKGGSKGAFIKLTNFIEDLARRAIYNEK